MGKKSTRSITSVGYLYPSEEIMQELYVNFVQDMDPEEVDFIPSLMFQVEQAHWHYEDNTVDQNPRLKSLSIKDFTYFFFKSCDLFKTYHANHVNDILDEFMAFKHSVPVAGSIILDQSKQRCLLVRGWKSNSWSFPRGKREDPDEEDHICAIRETMEEVGYDISSFLNVNDLIEHSQEKQRVVLYIIKAVDEKYPFEPRTKKEVSEIAWHPLRIMGRKRNKYFMVGPFLRKLEKWIKRNPTTSSTTPLKEIGEISTIWKADKEQINSTPRRFSITPNAKIINTPNTFQMGPSTKFINLRNHTTSSTIPLSQTREICTVWKAHKEQINLTPRSFSITPNAKMNTPNTFQMGSSNPSREVQNSTPNSTQKRPSTPRWSKSNINNSIQRSSSRCWNSQTTSPYSSSSPYPPPRSPYPKTNSRYSTTSPYPHRSSYSSTSPYPPRYHHPNSSPYPRSAMKASNGSLWIYRKVEK
ncbi:hypothetical protein SUGI_0423850 [Cryptomeria japonica]|uniref:mRNA-decapping enzyme subunit 2-like n=1 Tax=Cryptomeria japonica TaxID=3369 RepID=UPI002408E429|nr:mRNA-decapping enzyme subunit 2-like [Cryptomeria japonica]GLJ22514.1 hypothetical protein SUGI_0423850 [Cryptomeria japonica]